jgi:hypothetical protein
MQLLTAVHACPLSVQWCGCREAIDEGQFHLLADETLANLQDKVDEYVENKLDYGDVSHEVSTPENSCQPTGATALQHRTIA